MSDEALGSPVLQADSGGFVPFPDLQRKSEMPLPDQLDTALDWALAYLQLGWNPLAAPPGKKRPVGSWKRWQTDRMTEAEARSQFEKKDRSIWLACGRVSSLVVLDIDSAEAEQDWRERLGEALIGTAHVHTAKGVHYYYAIESGETVPSWGEEGMFDVRAEGAGVIAPPSIHESGAQYVWAVSPWSGVLLPLPDALRRGGAIGRQRARSVSGGQGDGTTDTLAHLLESPPPEGGRNNWLARVAGMLALRNRDKVSFELAVRSAASRLEPPLPDEEINKLIPSIWNAEQAKFDGAELPTLATGWLASGGDTTICLTMSKGGESVDQWADADIKALGVSQDRDGALVYDVLITKPDAEPCSSQLDSRTLSDGRKLAAWMLGNGVHQFTPYGGPKHPAGVLLSKYLESQRPERFEVVTHLGWHEPSNAYITLEGRITKEGAGRYRGVKPTTALRERAHKYEYRFGGREKAKELLKEVLTFHEEDAVAIIGAWWAATLLKAQLQERFKLFPILEVAASSESGKTTGFIPLLCQLGGSQAGALSEVTVPAFRDALAPHEGIVRVDDKGDLEPIKNLLRAAPMGASTIKKGGANWSLDIEIETHAAIMITGQGQGVGKEKALADRIVSVELGNPTQRRSLHDPAEMQLVDVVAMETHLRRAGYGGEFIHLALDWWTTNEAAYRVGAGRLANKHAILRVGAGLLSAITNNVGWTALVERRLEAEAGGDTLEDALTLDILPHVLATIEHKDQPEDGRNDHDPVTPVLIDKDSTVWFSPRALEQWLRIDLRQQWDPRLHSIEGIEQQARAIGLGGTMGAARKQFRVRSNGAATPKKLVYWSVQVHSAAVLARVHGGNAEPEQLGL